MNKLVLAGVSLLAISLSTATFAAQDTKDTKDAKDAKVEVTAEAPKAKADCPPKKKHKKIHKKHKHEAAHKGALWVNAEEPCVVPAPCAPVCEPTCPPAPCPPAPVCEPTCPPAPTCEPTCPPPAPACDPLPTTCVPQCFGGVTSYPYMYHGGYFYYPNAQGTLVAGFTPTFRGGAYWYASRMHPYDVYAERRPVLYVTPHGMQTPAAMQKAKAAAKKVEAAKAAKAAAK